MLLVLAPHQVGVFRLSRFIPDGIVQIKRRVRVNQALSGGVSAILQSGLIIKNIRRMFSSKFMYIVPVAQIDSKKHFSNVFEN